jgi:hypothetical protein
MLEIWQTINRAVHASLEDELPYLNEHELMQRADVLLLQLPIVGGSQPTAAQLLRRYRGALQHELCQGREPRPLPDELEDEVRELTRAVMVVMGGHEGMSVDIAVLLALAIRASGVQHLCESPVATAS